MCAALQLTDKYIKVCALYFTMAEELIYQKVLAIAEGTEGIKLTKNTKGYQWELKTLIKDSNDKAAVKRLGELDDMLAERFIPDVA